MAILENGTIKSYHTCERNKERLMGQVDKRSITLSPELAAAVDDVVAAGEYASASEVIRDALRQWKDRRDLFGYTVEELRKLVQEGIDSGPALVGPPILERVRAKYLKMAEAKGLEE
ncbi:type II toxin-antitoxin system ParD family antitoxin [Mesorhizobium sp. B2-3-5]|nr:type II toxin-antitoxin system ParD family antitoxin [Mesorhizobium sp. B2-3-5]